MKTIILAGGHGTRIAEETHDKPKPMVLISGKPILWHIMNIYASQGYSDFIIATGYKGDVIETWVETLDTDWTIEVLNTGMDTQTGGRIKSCMEYIGNERVFVTYGDGLANINLHNLLNFHIEQNRLATVTAVRPPARFGAIKFDEGMVTHFGEKNQADEGWINGGFFVLEPKASQYISGQNDFFEISALPKLVRDFELSSYLHEGFWKPMDTLRDKQEFEQLAKLPTFPWQL